MNVEWNDEDCKKARDCMIGILRGHAWTISEGSRGVAEFDNAFQHAVGILALTAASQGNGDLAKTVRKLDWQELYLDRGDGSKDPAGWEADSGFGIWYTVEMYFGSDSYGWEVFLDHAKISDHDDPEQAKQSAQSDFEKRAASLVSSAGNAALYSVQDTWLVGGPPDLKAMSGSIESDRVIQLHFSRPVTDADRKWLLEAINAKIASGSDGEAAGAPEPPLARLLKEVDPELAKVLTDNAAYVRVIRNNVIEECAKIAETTALRNPHNIARDIRALALSSADRGGK